MLNNLFKVCWKWKNADIFCYKLTSLVSLLQGNVKKNPKKSMKIANIYREILHIFWTIWGIRLKLSGKMWLMIMLKVTKSQCFTLSLARSNCQIDPLALLGLMFLIHLFLLNQFILIFCFIWNMHSNIWIIKRITTLMASI